MREKEWSGKKKTTTRLMAQWLEETTGGKTGRHSAAVESARPIGPLAGFGLRLHFSQATGIQDKSSHFSAP